MVNGAEFEEELLRLTLSGILFRETSWSDFISKIYTVERRLLNVLSAARLFLDHTRHSASRLFGAQSDEVTQIERTTNEEYDALLGYRVMEELRNHVQHRGLAVHSLSQDSWWVEHDGEGRNRHSLAPYLRPDKLDEEGGFKAGLLAELHALGDEIDLRPLVRQYVSALARVQILFRDVTRARAMNMLKVLEKLLEEYRVDSGKAPGLIVTKIVNGKPVEAVHVFDDPMKRRDWLIRKNGSAEHVTKHYVVAEPRGPINGG